MGIIIIFSLIGLMFSDLLYTPFAGILIGFLSGVVYNLSQKISKIEETLVSQDKIIDKFFSPALKELSIEDNKNFDEYSKKSNKIEIKTQEEIVILSPKKETIQNDENPFELFKSLKHILIGGNPLVRIGGFILFLGLSFFANFLIINGFISIEMRMVGIAIVGLIILSIGWKLRDREGDYGLILQGLGIAILYLVIFSSAKLYELIPMGIAFLLMLVVVLFSSWLSIIQKSLPMILFSIIGGFLVPILTSDYSGNHILLFSYYLLLNLAILIISYFHSWRVLNLVGFVFTFIISTLWGVLRYEDELFDTTEPFLILFFIFYLSINILFSRGLKEFKYVDSSVTFGVPFIVFLLQQSMIGYDDKIMIGTSLAMTIIYLLLSLIVGKKEHMKDLSYSFFAIGIIFTTITLSYIYDGYILSVIWAIEATATIWLALKQNRYISRILSLGILLISTINYLFEFRADNFDILFTEIFVSGIIISLIFMVIAWLYHHYKGSLRDSELSYSSYILLIGIVLYNLLSYKKTYDMMDGKYIYLLFLSSWGFISFIIYKVLNWQNLALFLGGFFAIGFFAIVTPEVLIYHPLREIGILSLGLFFTIHFTTLYYLQDRWAIRDLWHILGALLLVLIFSCEIDYQALRYNLSQQNHTMALMLPSMFSFVIIYLLKTKLANYIEIYKYNIIPIIAFVLLIFNFKLLGYIDDSYIPILSFIDIISIISIFLFYFWIKDLPTIYKQNLLIGLGIYSLIFITVILARTMHIYLGVDYDLSILSDRIYHMSLSILWGIVALISISISQYKRNRRLWFASITLIGLIVLKLFTIDLSGIGTIERVVSFIAIGGLILVIGYFAPLPPIKESE